jgi:DtxR family Mn-dependent transcriptional regulator
MLSHKIEEVLESIWTEQERGVSSIKEINKRAKVEITDEVLDELLQASLVTNAGDRIYLTETGTKDAESVIRRHRLAERLLTDVLKRSVEETEETACAYEHFLAPEITEGICTLLGHPKTCPHGSNIPPGKCCLDARKTVESAVISLDKLKAGESGRIAYITTHSHPRLHKLLSFGFAPGLTVHLHQRSPTFIIECDKTQLALEKEIARDIFIWKKESGK